MDNRNFEFLKAQIKYTGFGDRLDQQLQSAINKQSPEFALHHVARFSNDQLSSALHFKKSPGNGLYFFNSYLATLQNQDQTEKLNQRFYIQRQGSITLKEAFNLLQGRSVEKQLLDRNGQQYRTWIHLDFKQSGASGNFPIRYYHQNYGFDLAGQLSKLPLKELDDPGSKAWLLESLRKGNRQQVTLLEGAIEHRLYIEANPQFKAIIAYDQNSARRQIHESTQGRGQDQRKDYEHSLAIGQNQQHNQGLSAS
nr:hypothetical protein [uncultured Dyadobacter sp.]